MMGAAAGFHRNDAGRELRGQAHDSFALHATPQNDFARGIKPGDAAAVLTQINAENRDIHGCAPCFRIAPYQLSRRGGPSIRGAERNALGRSRGGFSTKINARTNAEGLPIGVVITPGQAHDVTAFPALMQEIDCDPEQMLGDKGYDSEAVRNNIEERGGEAAIPSTATRKIQHAVDKALYALRNRIERFFNRAKNSRRVATRYDKLIESFAAFVLLACIRIWIKFVHTT
jgi:transposase